MPLVSAVKAYLWHWKQALMGPLVTIALLFYQQGAGKPPTWGWFVALIAIGLAWQFYSELRKAEASQRSDCPRLFLSHAETPKERFAIVSGFFLQVEGPKKAFGVEIFSADADGEDGAKIHMTWSKVEVPVGENPVPLMVMCASVKGKTVTAVNGDQLGAYRRQVMWSKDLIATVRFKDVDGNDCPERKFRIRRERDAATGDMKTFCDPIKN